MLNRTEFRIQNPVSRILHGNNLRVLSPIKDVVSIVRTLKEMRKDANFLLILDSGFWILGAHPLLERTF